MPFFSKGKSGVDTFYKIEKSPLGSGNFAVVKKAFKIEMKEADYKKMKPPVEADEQAKKAKIPAQVAVKIIDKAKVEDMGDIEREVEIMGMIEHPNVIKLFEIYDEPKKMNLVMELVTGGELFDRIVAQGQYTEKDAAKCIGTMCDALKYLHEKKVVHRDLKPENILYASTAPDADLKIADFGLARMVSGGDMMKTACGTPGYVAPEILKNQGYDSGAVDCWSVGVILYILLCGFPPFYEEELPALFDQIMKARYDFPTPWWDTISPEAKALVKALLVVDPKKRLTAAGVLDNEWIMNKAPDLAITGLTAQMKKYNATRKLKKAAQAIMGQNKMRNLTKALKDIQAAEGCAK